ncbi:hypothetical protein GCM10027614_62610 [Micromonospora vulcania]
MHYVVVARHPLDMAVSLYHQAGNLNRDRLRELAGQPVPAGPPRARQPLEQWLPSWVDHEVDPRAELDSLPGVLWHLGDAWARRHEPNVELVHYDDLRADLGGQMRRLADRWGIEVPTERWPELVEAATFGRMKERADQLAPDRLGVLLDRQAFFRRGGSGQGRDLLDAAGLARYQDRVAALAPPDLLAWLHRDA